MAEKYDAIVIGAGLGGLSAATQLAHEGLGVLLLERHNVPGGYATSFVRGRFEFEVALHELSGIGPPDRPGTLLRYLNYLGVGDKVEFHRLNNLYRTVVLGEEEGSGIDLDITLPVGREAFEDTLCRAFPHEAKGIRRFVKRVFDLGRDYGRVYRNQGRVGNPATMPFRYPHLFRYLPVTCGQVLDRDVSDPQAKAALTSYWGYFGLPPSQLSFLYFAIGLAAYVKQLPAFPKGRSQALSNAFVTTFEEYGGQLKLNCGVERIMTTNGRVSGVVTEQGEEYKADWIVSNADPITTCREMIGEDKVPDRFFTRLQSSDLGPATFNIYMGVDRPPEELGLKEHEIFLEVGYDVDKNAKLIKRIEPPRSIGVACYNFAYPEISPPGTSIVVLISLADGEPWYHVPPEDYVDTKNQLAGAMIDTVERISPGLREHTEVIEVATPLTNMRYASAMGGSIYGFNQPPRDNVVWRMSHRGPLDGLYFAGAWARPGGGFEPAIMSGGIAGGSILGKIKKMQKEA
jgi:prolycopene isomerase